MGLGLVDSDRPQGDLLPGRRSAKRQPRQVSAGGHLTQEFMRGP
jgi:hypothetical protein